MTTLTLNIDQRVVADAEVYAKRTRKTVPQLVEEFLLSISGANNENQTLAQLPEKSPRASLADTAMNTNTAVETLGPITQRLTGIIKLDKDVDYKELLTEALTEKYL